MTSVLEHRAATVAWETKEAFRVVYMELLERIALHLGPGPVLELGGGASHLRSVCPEAIVSDLVPTCGIDVVANAEQLPFADRSLGNIVLFDVLHHIPAPIAFLDEAARVLRSDGRLIMLEPALTLGSYLFYKFFHAERLDVGVNPLSGLRLSSRDPYDANQAIPTLLCTRYRAQLAQRVPTLSLRTVQWMSLLAYPLSGGVRPWSLLSGRAARLVLSFERRLPALIHRLFGFRLLMVLARIPDPSDAAHERQGSESAAHADSETRWCR